MKRPLIIAHRGASHAAPENTLAAFRLAWEMESDAIEIDLHLTLDGEIVVIHDPSTTRTAGVEHLIAETLLAGLKTLDFGSFKGPPWSGERLPTLREVLAAVPPGKKVVIEIKAGRAILPVLKKELETCAPAPSQLCLMAFDDELLAEARALLPEIACFWLTSAYHRSGVADWPETTRRLLETRCARSFDGIAVGVQQAKDLPALCRELRTLAEATPVLVWTINDPAMARALLALPLHGIITDRPDLIRALPA
ncbi:MAG TPA: glycerophosphodiester phosphodiesterase family protein [Chthoniobacteraceae bacterium]|nr:glycerophosphodiester phosphodiesterase family protein [Chthoniobacteraceae bacterium]